jgi:hypothetical protein
MKVLFARDCPNCKKSISYSSKQSFSRAEKEERVCHSCRYILYPCVYHERTEEEKLRFSLFGSKNRGKTPWNKGIPCSDTTKQNISDVLKNLPTKMASWHVGKRASRETIKRLSDSHVGQISPMLGKRHTEETKVKIRESLIENFKKRNISSKYNPRACKFMDEINLKNDWDLQHALNGGEVVIAGYFLDGYDKNRGIIFEYDEPKHHLAKKKEKDIARQNRILEHFKKLGKEVKFYRYDERYNELYEVVQ